jgi:hypothetical protein
MCRAIRRSHGPRLSNLQVPSARASTYRRCTGFYCTIHGHFKIANTVALDDYYTRAEWEVALRAAKHKAMEGEWPVIWPWDFFRERES